MAPAPVVRTPTPVPGPSPRPSEAPTLDVRIRADAPLAEVWSAAIDAMTKQSQRVLFEPCQLRSLSDGKAVIGAPAKSLFLLKSDANEAVLVDALTRVTGRSPRLEWLPVEGPPAGANGANAGAEGSASVGPSGAELSQQAREHPLVQSVVELLGARVVRVGPRRADDR
ncbi:MAG: hypothetical protein ACREJO_10560 [Phycisphaerales bacterium]